MAGFLALLAGVSFVISLVMTLMMLRVSPALGLVDHPGERKVHSQATPSGGGVAIFAATWGPIGAAVAVCLYVAKSEAGLAFWPELSIHAAGVISLAPRLGIIFLGALVIWALGLADDRWNISPWIRLMFQIGVALLLILSGRNISIFIESAWIRGAITLVWIVGLINAFNMLDNMDGLSAGVGMIIAAVFTIVALQTGQLFIAAFLCCLIGALGGFLVYNFPPAGIFMGDSGGTLVGYLLAVMTVEFTFFQPERPLFPVVVPLMMFGLPLFDMVTVMWIRLRAGRSPFRGDTNHFSHRLVALGMTARQAVLTIYLVTATVALGATVLYYAKQAAVLLVFAQAVAIFTIIGILERARPQEARPRPLSRQGRTPKL